MRLLATRAGTASYRRAHACTRAKPGVRRGRRLDEEVSGESALRSVRSDRRSIPMMAEARLVSATASRLTFRSCDEMKFLGDEGWLWRGSNGIADQALKPAAEFFTTSDLRMTIDSAFGWRAMMPSAAPPHNGRQEKPSAGTRRFVRGSRPAEGSDKGARADPMFALQAGPAIPIRISPSCGSAWSHSGQDARAVPRRGRLRHREHESHALNPLAAS